MAEYANIIVDIFNEKLDKTFQYRIPEAMKEKLTLGMQVYVPFGKRNIKGYVVELTDEPEFEVAKIKEIIGIVTDSVPIESQLIALAGWMKKNYGATMNHALKTVIPIKKKSNAVEHKSVRLKLTEIEAKSELAEFERKHQKARVRLLSALIENPQMDQSMITQKLNVSGTVIRALETMGIVEVVSERSYRNPVSHLDSKGSSHVKRRTAVRGGCDRAESGSENRKNLSDQGRDRERQDGGVHGTDRPYVSAGKTGDRADP